jgi:hypothetical protein
MPRTMLWITSFTRFSYISLHLNWSLCRGTLQGMPWRVLIALANNTTFMRFENKSFACSYNLQGRTRIFVRNFTISQYILFCNKILLILSSWRSQFCLINLLRNACLLLSAFEISHSTNHAKLYRISIVFFGHTYIFFCTLSLIKLKYLPILFNNTQKMFWWRLCAKFCNPTLFWVLKTLFFFAVWALLVLLSSLIFFSFLLLLWLS